MGLVSQVEGLRAARPCPRPTLKFPHRYPPAWRAFGAGSFVSRIVRPVRAALVYHRPSVIHHIAFRSVGDLCHFTSARSFQGKPHTPPTTLNYLFPSRPPGGYGRPTSSCALRVVLRSPF